MSRENEDTAKSPHLCCLSCCLFGYQEALFCRNYWCWRQESNPRPTDYKLKSPLLPTDSPPLISIYRTACYRYCAFHGATFNFPDFPLLCSICVAQANLLMPIYLVNGAYDLSKQVFN